MERELNTKDIRTVVLILLVGLIAVMGVILWASRTLNAQEVKKEYKLSEIQLLKLQVLQKDALLLKAQKEEVDRRFAEKVSELMATAQKMKLENGWAPETQFNPDNLQFSEAPKAEVKK